MCSRLFAQSTAPHPALELAVARKKDERANKLRENIALNFRYPNVSPRNQHDGLDANSAMNQVDDKGVNEDNEPRHNLMEEGGCECNTPSLFLPVKFIFLSFQSQLKQATG